MTAPIRAALVSFDSSGPRTYSAAQVEQAFQSGVDYVAGLGVGGRPLYVLVGPAGGKLRITREGTNVHVRGLIRFAGDPSISAHDLDPVKRQMLSKIESNLGSMFESQHIEVKAFTPSTDGTLAAWESGAAQRTGSRDGRSVSTEVTHEPTTEADSFSTKFTAWWSDNWKFAVGGAVLSAGIYWYVKKRT